MFLSFKKYQKYIGLKVQLLLVHFKWIKPTFRNRYKRIFVFDLHNCFVVFMLPAWLFVFVFVLPAWLFVFVLPA